jgi:glycosyltransferase involved in cell wall biosynthesis
MTNSYIVVTAVKDEEENLPNLIKSITLQTIRPSLWVLVDDGSTDKTSDIIEEAGKKHSWIKGIKMPLEKRDLGIHFSKILKKGFDFAEKYCKTNGIEYHYLANVDGDLTLPTNFFENLIKEFQKNEKLGLASGTTKHVIDEKILYAKMREDEPSGGHMLIKKVCFEQCEGIPVSYACDTVIKAKARIRGWETKRFEENIAVEMRDSNTAEGYWKGFFHQGKSSYYLNLHPLHILYRSFNYSRNGPYYVGIPYLIGYISNLLRRRKQIDEPELRYYFWNKFKKYF